MKHIYLDYAAATPMDKEVLKAMGPYFRDKFYNPSAAYLAGRAARQELDDIRRQAAATLGAKPPEIVFTAGATEANNLAIQGIMRRFPEGRLLVSAAEHESVLQPARLSDAAEIPVDSKGVIILNKLSNLISERTVLISVMLVNNELGAIQPLKDIAEIIAEVRRARLAEGNELPLFLHTDAAQAGNYLDLHVSRLKVDLMSINGGKIYGPKQAGILYIKAGISLRPLIAGGGQEFGLRSGTENIAAAAGLVKALQMAADRRSEQSRRITRLREEFENKLSAQLPQARINGPQKGRAPHIVSITIPGKDNERVMMELDERGIQCAVGSACSAQSGEASHVLSAIGLSQADARATLRFSLGRHTTQTDINETIIELIKLCSKN